MSLFGPINPVNTAANLTADYIMDTMSNPLEQAKFVGEMLKDVLIDIMTEDEKEKQERLAREAEEKKVKEEKEKKEAEQQRLAKEAAQRVAADAEVQMRMADIESLLAEGDGRLALIDQHADRADLIERTIRDANNSDRVAAIAGSMAALTEEAVNLINGGEETLAEAGVIAELRMQEAIARNGGGAGATTTLGTGTSSGQFDQVRELNLDPSSSQFVERTFDRQLNLETTTSNDPDISSEIQVTAGTHLTVSGGLASDFVRTDNDYQLIGTFEVTQDATLELNTDGTLATTQPITGNFTGVQTFDDLREVTYSGMKLTITDAEMAMAHHQRSANNVRALNNDDELLVANG